MFAVLFPLLHLPDKPASGWQAGKGRTAALLRKHNFL
jgi:hypothetical protein